MNTEQYEKLQVGDNVVATCQITEDGKGDGNPAAIFDVNAEEVDGKYIHAEAGEMGEVIHANDNCPPTVRFERSGTATIVREEEIDIVETPIDVESEICALFENMGCGVRCDKGEIVVSGSDDVEWTIRVEPRVVNNNPAKQ